MNNPHPRHEAQRGSALVMAIFALVLMAGVGVALLFVGQNEVKMSAGNASHTRAFFVAEAGLEVGRAVLMSRAPTGDMGPELAAAAGDGIIDFDLDSMATDFSGTGAFAGFSNYGNDIPLVSQTKLGDDGWYVVFLTNDPADVVTSMTDTNSRVMLTSIAVRDDQTVESVQALIEPEPLLPSFPSATIMMLGPTPNFDGGGYEFTGTACSSDSETDDSETDDSETDDSEDDSESDCTTPPSKTFSGTDCGGTGGIAGLFVPVIGTIDDTTETTAEAGMYPTGTGTWVNNNYVSDTHIDVDTVANMNDAAEVTVIGSGAGTLDADWQNCTAMLDLVEDLRSRSTECTAPCSTLPAMSPTSKIFIDGDTSISSTVSGQGLLVVTGRLEMDAAASWSGLILALGEGVFVRTGTSGNGAISGATIVADIAGPDNTYGTSDDCTGGTAGFDTAQYHEAAEATGDTTYCSTDIANAAPLRRYEMVGFRQH